MVVLLILMFTTIIDARIKPPKIGIGQTWVRNIVHKGSNFVDTVKIINIDNKHIEYTIISSNRNGKTFETFFLKNFKYVK